MSDDPRTVELARLGFGPTFVTSADWGGATLTSCKVCGAAVRIEPGVSNEEQPVVRHYDWHDATGTVPR